ncbi:unnamed protein product (macronuclear) [Paramecium tetraurelia]|uniref:EF-hand domain-containing protein n=1 Tax=Paramecium tetraurelia TaxID=5888 RepID=A0CHF3_PARTE|nr:uncharacterized protein GSPATT00038322001 [Paramecium tetraurelia]CAK70220.1 unnamed protein product [Paramecium tetraurelia]|eukprot:XP_001437617.1 hypothetical protein (macronuclear) [Paramecium tetraurelia strain d4-2]
MINVNNNLEDEFDGLTIEKLSGIKRSVLQSRDVHDWFKKRYNDKVKKKYLYFPEEIKQQLEVKKIFQNFDQNKSSIEVKFNLDNLDMSELYEMFQKNGFKITEEQSQKFFKIVDKDRDNALNWSEFKNSAFNEQAAQVFYEIMKELRENMEKEQKLDSSSPAGKYMPFTFNNMISYLSYLASRDELKKAIDDTSITQLEKFKKYMEMINLNSTISVQKRNQSTPEVDILHEEVGECQNLDQEQEFIKRNEQRFNLYKNSFYNSQSASKSPKSQKQPNVMPKEQLLRVPKKLREIDAIVRSHQIPETQSLFKLKEKTNNSIIKLKQDVSKYIHLAKTQYNINVDELQIQSTKSKPPLTLKIRNFEEDFKNALAAHQMSQSNSEPYFKFNGSSVQEHQLPILEEQSKIITNPNLFGDHLPISVYKNQENFKEHNKIHLIQIHVSLYSKPKVMYKIQHYQQFTKTAISQKSRSQGRL